MNHAASEETRGEARLLCALALTCYLTTLACLLALGYTLAAHAAADTARHFAAYAAAQRQ